MRLRVGALFISRRKYEVVGSSRTCGLLADGGCIAVLSGSGGELYCVHIDYCLIKFNMLYSKNLGRFATLYSGKIAAFPEKRCKITAKFCQ